MGVPLSLTFVTVLVWPPVTSFSLWVHQSHCFILCPTAVSVSNPGFLFVFCFVCVLVCLCSFCLFQFLNVVNIRVKYVHSKCLINCHLRLLKLCEKSQIYELHMWWYAAFVSAKCINNSARTATTTNKANFAACQTLYSETSVSPIAIRQVWCGGFLTFSCFHCALLHVLIYETVIICPFTWGS